MLSYTWQGMEEVQRRLSALAGMRGLDTELEAAADDILPTVRAYPPELPNQRYRRTFTLRDAWRRNAARRTGRSVVVDLGNPIEYGPDVMGDNQEPAFRGRWKPLRQIGQEQRGAVRARVQAWALRTWRGA